MAKTVEVKLTPNVMKNIDLGLRNGIDVNLDLIVKTAKTKVPVDTGNLKDSIKKRDDGIVMDGYGLYVEFGTRHMGAQPFIRPSIASVEREAIALVIEEQRKAMRKL